MTTYASGYEVVLIIHSISSWHALPMESNAFWKNPLSPSESEVIDRLTIQLSRRKGIQLLRQKATNFKISKILWSCWVKMIAQKEAYTLPVSVY